MVSKGLDMALDVGYVLFLELSSSSGCTQYTKQDNTTTEPETPWLRLHCLNTWKVASLWMEVHTLPLREEEQQLPELEHENPSIKDLEEGDISYPCPGWFVCCKTFRDAWRKQNVPKHDLILIFAPDGRVGLGQPWIVVPRVPPMFCPLSYPTVFSSSNMCPEWEVTPTKNIQKSSLYMCFGNGFFQTEIKSSFWKLIWNSELGHTSVRVPLKPVSSPDSASTSPSSSFVLVAKYLRSILSCLLLSRTPHLRWLLNGLQLDLYPNHPSKHLLFTLFEQDAKWFPSLEEEARSRE